MTCVISPLVTLCYTLYATRYVMQFNLMVLYMLPRICYAETQSSHKLGCCLTMLFDLV